MFKWVQSGISAVTGIAEPEYGPDHIHAITDTVKGKQPFTEATRDDFKWISPSVSNVETQTFYFTDLSKGLIGFAQVIHSNVASITPTAQFTFKIYDTNTSQQIWTSTKLEDFIIKGNNFYARDMQIELADDKDEYRLVSKVNPESIVDLTFTKVAPACKIGADGTTVYGPSLEEPWGTMRHIFWPRNRVSGVIKSTNAESGVETTYDIDGYSMFVMALQGMKPHHAAAKWNFLNFQSESLSCILMDFTTPKSYASTKVSIAFISNDEGIVCASADNDCNHLKIKQDEEVGWPAPTAIEFDIHGVDGRATDEEVAAGEKKVEAKVYGDLTLIERVDVMSEIPQFVKNLVSGVVGTKPYIYQSWNNLTIECGDVKEQSIGYVENTFITES